MVRFLFIYFAESAMNSFLILFNSLSPDSNIKGKQFEIIAKWFLENASE